MRIMLFIFTLLVISNTLKASTDRCEVLAEQIMTIADVDQEEDTQHLEDEMVELKCNELGDFFN